MATILISTLAEYQTEFWSGAADLLRRRGHEVIFLSFDDRSTESLRKLDFRVHALSDVPAPRADGTAFEELLARYGIDNINHWFSHERAAFGIRDSARLKGKLMAACAVAERAFAELDSMRGATMVQELGGFLSVVGSYFVAQRHRVPNLFIEPSFFRGRLFFTPNSFAAPRVRGPFTRPPSADVAEYLEKTLERRAIAIPLKDKHQYATPLHKVLNARNAKRLVQKLVDKHVHGKRQEFGYIGRHVAMHADMVLNSARLRRHCQNLSTLGRFVYYPLHVPADVALTLRSPQYLDQLALVDYLARSVPHSHVVAIKEHPAMMGAVEPQRMLELLRRHDNLVLLAPQNNNFDVLKASDCVVSVNSKSGAEAILLGKPVLVLGDAFYRDCPHATALDSVHSVPATLREILSSPPHAPTQAQVGSFFEAVWRQTLPGELYVCENENWRRFVESLERSVLTESIDNDKAQAG